MGGRGLEQTALTPSKTPIVSPRGTESGTLETDFDPDLAFIVRHWHDLKPDIRRVILHTVRSSIRTPDAGGQSTGAGEHTDSTGGETPER